MNYIYFYPKEYSSHPFESFAFDEVLQNQVSTDGISRVRSWVHENTVVLGLKDMRVSDLDAGLKAISNAGFDFMVRNSGGLGVVLDSGILNFSLILHKNNAVTIEAGYEIMYQLIKDSFSELKIDAYEIANSYCPGSFDLSVEGRKFAGISQRRIKNAVAIQIYLAVEGSGEDRAEVMKQFYNASVQEETNYPVINSKVMASLSELFQPMTVFEAETRILNTISKSNEIITSKPFQGDDLMDFERQLRRMTKRNEKLGY